MVFIMFCLFLFNLPGDTVYAQNNESVTADILYGMQYDT